MLGKRPTQDRRVSSECEFSPPRQSPSYDAVAMVQQVVESSEDVATVREKLLSVVLNEDECGCSMETDPILQREQPSAAKGLTERSSEH